MAEEPSATEGEIPKLEIDDRPRPHNRATGFHDGNPPRHQVKRQTQPTTHETLQESGRFLGPGKSHATMSYRVQSLCDRYIYYPFLYCDPVKANICFRKEHPLGPRICIRPQKKDRDPNANVRGRNGGEFPIGPEVDLSKEPIIEAVGPRGRETIEITIFKLPPKGPKYEAAAAAEWATLKAIFETCDKNKDGRVSRRELKTALKANPALANALGLKRVKDAKAFVEAADADADGGVDFGEFAAFMAETAMVPELGGLKYGKEAI